MNPVEILQQHSIKKTSPRVAIIQALQKRSAPLTESEIKAEMGDLYDRITFYRNMQSMADAGILHRIVVDNTMVKYALNHCNKEHCHHTNHAHFYCRECTKLICLDDIAIEAQVPEGYIREEMELLIRGICSHCNTEHKA
ncbi:MAG: transcriptional repressor [Prolixibacteraceae bacterium]|nr:transcriptional repressor [Prolixibacteraceae bacterium]